MTGRKKIRLEFEIRASPAMVYSYISLPYGLSKWFCNDVLVFKNNFTFIWDNEELTAELVKQSNNKCIKFHWKETSADEFLELEIIKDELTGDVALVVIDFVDETDEINATKLWESQIHDLRGALGA